jgi:hypothetical protein
MDGFWIFHPESGNAKYPGILPDILWLYWDSLPEKDHPGMIRFSSDLLTLAPDYPQLDNGQRRRNILCA